TWTPISPDYFKVFRIPLSRGRTFDARDVAGGSAVAIISKSLADRLWPGADPLGAEISFDIESEKEPRRIVGVVAGDMAANGLDHAPMPGIYVPEGQTKDEVTAMISGQFPLTWILRTIGDPALSSETVALALQQATGLAPGRIRPMTEVLSRSISRQKFN